MIESNIANRVFSITDFGAVSGAGVDNTRAIQDALVAAQQEGGELFVPSGIWEFSESIRLQSTGGEASLHRVRGSGWRSELRYVGTGSAITHSGTMTGLVLRDFQLRGNAQAQAGIDFDSPGSAEVGNISIENVFVRSFTVGVGIRLGEAYFSRLLHNRVFDTRIGIDCRRVNSCEIKSNLVRRWQFVGIHIGNPESLSVNNAVSANTVDEPVASNEVDRAAIWLETASSNVVDGNYFECLGNHLVDGKCADGFPHGILIKSAIRSQSNTISNNFFSGNNGLKSSAMDRNNDPDAGFAISLGHQAWRTQILGNQLGEYVIQDDGSRNIFMMVNSGVLEGTGNTRRGWSVIDDEVIQHH